jgi:AbrB family looped-hinge helix DNA binding protein
MAAPRATRPSLRVLARDEPSAERPTAPERPLFPSTLAEAAPMLVFGLAARVSIPLSYDRTSIVAGGSMEKVTISPKYQVVIPRSVRERLRLKPGQQVQVIAHEGRIEFIPLRPARELRGSLSGLSTELRREADRL